MERVHASRACVCLHCFQVILDKYTHPWEHDLAELFEAVFISPHASRATRRYAEAVHTALVEKLGYTDDPTRLPLLHYDVTKTSNPFTHMPAS